MKFPKLIRRDVQLARDWQTQLAMMAQASEHHARRLFLNDFGKGGVALGRAETAQGWQWVRTDRFLASHILTTGATGTGKSREIAAVLYQILRAQIPTFLVDLKSELSGVAVDTLVPALAHQGIDVGPIRVVRPFDPKFVPLLRLTEPEVGVSREIQALNLATALGEAVGEDLKIRMHRAFLRLCSLAIEKNLPLPVIAEWASNPQQFTREARSSSDPQVKRYASHEFARESRASLDALRARLDELFHLREIRLALSAPTCLSFPETLESGLTIFDLGSPPAGAELAVRFIGGPILGRLTRAVLSRPPGKPCLIVYEEFQEILGKHQVEQFKRLLALSRFKGVCLWFSNQQIAQIDDVDPMLRRILRTNAGLEMIFRSSIEDAAKLSQGLSIRRPHESLAAARQRFTEDVASLPQREFYLWVKDAPYGPQRIRSPKMDLEELDTLGRQLSIEDRLAIQRGVVSISVDQVCESVPEEIEEEPIRKKSRLG